MAAKLQRNKGSLEMDNMKNQADTVVLNKQCRTDEKLERN